MIAIIDYGMGNLRSVQKALERVGADARVTHDSEWIGKADGVVLPGVGAIQAAMDRLRELELIPVIRKVSQSRPFLGICLGYQLMFERSDEGGDVEGIGLLKGRVVRFREETVKVPHMGWNQLQFRQKDCPLLREIDDQSDVYFCHSYYVCPDDLSLILTSTDYGGEFPSAIAADTLFGVQFHPEKSQSVGLKILENFVSISEERGNP